MPTGALLLPSSGGLGLFSFGGKDSKSGHTASPNTSASSTSIPARTQEAQTSTPSETTWTAGENLLKKRRKELGFTPSRFTSIINQALPNGTPPIDKGALSKMEDGTEPIHPLVAKYLLQSAQANGDNILRQQLDRRGWTYRQLSYYLTPFQPKGGRPPTEASLLNLTTGRSAIQPWMAAKIFELATYDTVKLKPLEKYGPPPFGVTPEVFDETLKHRGLTIEMLRARVASSSRKRRPKVTSIMLNHMRLGETRIPTQVARVIRELADSAGPNFWVPPTPAQLEAAKHIIPKDVVRQQSRRRLSDEVMLDDLNESAPEEMKLTMSMYRHMRSGETVIAPWVAEQFEQMKNSPNVHISAIHGPPFYGITPKHLTYQMQRMGEEKLIRWLNAQRPRDTKPLDSNLLHLLAEPVNLVPADQVARGRHQIPKWMAELLYRNILSGMHPYTSSSDMIAVSRPWMKTLEKMVKSRGWSYGDLVDELNSRRMFDKLPLTNRNMRSIKRNMRAPLWIRDEVRAMAKEDRFLLNGQGLQNIDAFIKASQLPDDTLTEILKGITFPRHRRGQPVTSLMLGRLFRKRRLPITIWQGLVEQLRPHGLNPEMLKKAAAPSSTFTEW
jgi:hypothetical protein